MKKTIRIFALLLALLLAASSMSTAAFAADSSTLDFSTDVQARYEGMLEGIEPMPIERTLYIEENYLASNWVSVGLIPYSICQWHGFSCVNKSEFTPDDFVIDYTMGGEYVTVSTAVAQYDGWSCITAKLDFTDEAKETVMTDPLYVTGNFYFHHISDQIDCQTQPIPFALLIVSKDVSYTEEQFTEAKKVPEPTLSDEELASMTKVVEAEPAEVEEVTFYHPEIIDEMPETLTDGYDLQMDVELAVNNWQNGEAANVIYRSMDCGKDYGWMPVMFLSSVTLLPCTIDSIYCSAFGDCTPSDVHVVLTENGDLMNAELREGEESIEMKLSMTEKAASVSYPVTVRGQLYTEKTVDGVAHVSEGIPFAIVLNGTPKVPSEGGSSVLPVIISGVAGLVVGAAIMFVVLKSGKKKAK